MKNRRPATRTPMKHRARTRAGRAGHASGAGTGSALKLPPECTLAEAEGLKLRLAKLLKSVKPVTIEVQAVRRIDTASMQLLAAFVRDRAASALPIRLRGDSPTFGEAVRLLGLAGLMRVDDAPGAA
jgi:anti-anti-sigma regulatory factor